MQDMTSEVADGSSRFAIQAEDVAHGCDLVEC
jgi:hypothetical protein